MSPAPQRPRLATVWLGGCAGCHMSFLDLDERLFDVAALADVVYSPIADVKEYPENVDIALVEGAVANEDNLELIHKVRARTRILVALGDCAIHGNVTALRNPLGSPMPVLRRAYVDGGDRNPGIPGESLPALLDQVRPLHEVVPVDAFLPGCPPSADLIHYAVAELLAGRRPDLSGRLKFG
jgi:NAD-reducing hydrogenase small subunit